MNNTKKIALAVAMLCASGATIAQEINPSWYIQPSVVGMKADSEFGVGDKDFGGGLKFGKPVSQLFDIQIGATYVPADDNGNKYKQTTVGVDSLLMFSRSNFRPFLLLGIGAERDKTTGRFNAKQNSVYVTAGLGFQAQLSERWAVQADYRTVQGHLKDDNDYGFSRSNNKYVTVGFNYAFNAPPVAYVAPAPAPMPVAVVEAPPAPMAPPPPPPARFEKVTMSATELFEFDKAVLRSPQPKLDEIAAALQADMSITDVDVTGYTDRLGSDKYNQKLSERRAVAVREYLIAHGIDGSRLKAVGKGEANPVVQCNDKKRADLIACLAPNRRVEVEQITIEKRVQ